MVTEGGWTVATLKEYIERRFDEADRIALARFETQKMAADKAVDVAKQTADKLSEYNREVLTRSEYEIAHSVLNDRLDGLTTRLDRHEGSARGVQTGWTTTVSAVIATGVVVTIIFALVEFLIPR